MAKKINIKGVIIPNEDKWIYDWFEIENTSPNDVINEIPNDGSQIELIINSPGGDVYAGSEIYTLLKDAENFVTGKIVGLAASAASVIAMAADNLLISPTAQMMIHNVSSMAWGDYRDFQHEAKVLENWNKSIASAYQLKSGKTYEELLAMMNDETWLNAQQALELKLVDGIMFQNSSPQLVASQSGILPANILNKFRNMKGELLGEPKEKPLLNSQLEEDSKEKLALAKEKLKNTILGGYKYAKKY